MGGQSGEMSCQHTLIGRGHDGVEQSTDGSAESRFAGGLAGVPRTPLTSSKVSTVTNGNLDFVDRNSITLGGSKRVKTPVHS